MNSLLQFNGQVSRKGARLEFYQTAESTKFMEYPQPDGTVQRNYYLAGSATCGDATDVIFLPNGKQLPRIWTAVRKPAGMFGPWVLWRVNGEQHPYDLSCPIATFRLPRDARPMPIDECLAAWNRA